MYIYIYIYIYIYMLEKLINDRIYWKVRDHSHCGGKYRGSAHSICNLRYSIQRNSSNFEQ